MITHISHTLTGHIYAAAAALAASLTLNVWLSLPIHHYTDLSKTFEEGTRFPLSAVEQLDGTTTDLLGTKPVIVHIFNSQCPWSRRNQANINALAELTQLRYRLVSIARDTDRTVLMGYLVRHPLRGELGFARHSDMQALDQILNVTPQLVVLTEDGIVDRTWIGALSGDRQAAAEAFFGGSLPGVGLDPLQDPDNPQKQLGMLLSPHQARPVAPVIRKNPFDGPMAAR